MAIPVRALWEATTDEDRERAHRRCIAILEMWLGKRSRRDVAEQLGLPPLRLWQLSQQAVSGMLVALVHQPRFRARGRIAMPPSQAQELAELRAKLKQVEAEKRVVEELNDVLRQVGDVMAKEKTAKEPVASKKSATKKRRSSRATGQRSALEPAPRAPAPRSPRSDRGEDPPPAR
jgi:hypothetical protein